MSRIDFTVTTDDGRVERFSVPRLPLLNKSTFDSIVAFAEQVLRLLGLLVD